MDRYNIIFDGNNTMSHAAAVTINGITVFDRVSFINHINSNNGGAIQIFRTTVRFDNCLFMNNHANDGGHIRIESAGGIYMHNAVLMHGSANFGGAISSNGWVELVSSTITRNMAHLGGGGIYAIAGHAFIDGNTKIYGNSGDDISNIAASINISGTIYSLRELFEDDWINPLHWQNADGEEVNIPLSTTEAVRLTLIYEEISRPTPSPTPTPQPSPTPTPQPTPMPTPSPTPSPTPLPDPTPPPTPTPTPEPTPLPPAVTPTPQPPSDSNDSHYNNYSSYEIDSSSGANWHIPAIGRTELRTEMVQQVTVDAINLTGDRFSITISPERLEGWGIQANSDISYKLEPIIIDGRPFWLDEPHSFGIWLDDDELNFNDIPIAITVDLYGLNLNNVQLDRLAAFVFDEYAGSYSRILGQLSKDGNIFTFKVYSNGIFGIMLTPEAIIRLAIDSQQYTVNGIAHINDVSPFIDTVYERTMVPIRVIAESLGADVDWIHETRTVIIEKGDVTLTLPIGQSLPYGMGTPIILNDRTFVPVRYVSEMLGADVYWDNGNRAVYIWQ